jgi:hypothetical protein
MSFRRVGGLNYSSKHNYVSSSNNTTGKLLISENVGLLNTCIQFESNIDASFCGVAAIPTGGDSSDNNVKLTGDQSIAGFKTFTDDALRISNDINQGTLYVGSDEYETSISTTGSSTDFTCKKPLRFMTHPLAPTTPIVFIDIGGLHVNTGKFYLDGIGNYYIKANTSTNANLMSSYAPSGAQFQWVVNSTEILKIGPAGIVMNNNNITLGTGTVSAASYNTTSDYRIKENAVTLDKTFSLDKLRPVTYTNLSSGKQDIGLIAHELQEVYPFLVTGEKDGAELQTVNYTGLIGVLIKEIQVLSSKVSNLEVQVGELRGKI